MDWKKPTSKPTYDALRERNGREWGEVKESATGEARESAMLRERNGRERGEARPTYYAPQERTGRERGETSSAQAPGCDVVPHEAPPPSIPSNSGFELIFPLGELGVQLCDQAGRGTKVDIKALVLQQREVEARMRRTQSLKPAPSQPSAALNKIAKNPAMLPCAGSGVQPCADSTERKCAAGSGVVPLASTERHCAAAGSGVGPLADSALPQCAVGADELPFAGASVLPCAGSAVLQCADSVLS